MSDEPDDADRYPTLSDAGRALLQRMVEHEAAPIYRNQRGTKTRMEVDPGTHEWLGVSHYAWSSSPLRRFSDLANQRQLVAMLRSAEPAYARDDLVAAAREFEAAYEAYADHQRALERYWCLKYIVQEGIACDEQAVYGTDEVEFVAIKDNDGNRLGVVCLFVPKNGYHRGKLHRVPFDRVLSVIDA